MNRHYLITTVLLLFIACSGCNNTKTLWPINEPSRYPEDDFRFVVAADPQLFRGKKAELDKAIQLMNKIEPEFVVMCGDLVETPANLEQIQAYKDAVSKLSLEITLYNVPGNHDLGRPFKKENIEVYQTHFGDLWYRFVHNNCLFIVLSSDILQDKDAPQYKQQTKWLTNTLEQYQSHRIENIFVFLHHPLYLNWPDEPDGYSNMPIQIRQQLLDLFIKHHVQAVFSGHYHNNKVNRYQEVDLITTNSITVPMGEIEGGFRVVEVYEDGYEQTYYTLQQLEKQEVME